MGKNKSPDNSAGNFANKVRRQLESLINSVPKAESLIVVHDDVDLPLGKLKISFGKSSGGHKGGISDKSTVKTVNFTRVRIGISSTNAKGAVKSLPAINFELHRRQVFGLRRGRNRVRGMWERCLQGLCPRHCRSLRGVGFVRVKCAVSLVVYLPSASRPIHSRSTPEVDSLRGRRGESQEFYCRLRRFFETIGVP